MVIPRVKFEINETDKLSGVKVMSLVDEPAIESDFVFFQKEKSKSNYIRLSGETYKQVVAGLALIPDKDILRFDSMGEPFYGYFTKDTVEVIRNKFHKELLLNRVNTDHSSANYIDAFLIESFLIDSEQRLADVKAKGIGEATIGSWYVAYKIEDQQTFDRVLSGELKGFSVEIFLSKFYKQDKNNLNHFENVMNKFLEKLKTLLAEAEQEEPKKFEDAKDDKGQVIRYTAKDEAVSIVEVAEDGTEKVSPAPDGTYNLDNGKIVTVASGVATDIADAPVQQEKETKVEEPAKDENLEAIKTELAKVKEELKSANEQIEKLKKAPIANPVVQQLKKTKKLTDAEFNKLSNVEQILYRKGLLELN